MIYSLGERRVTLRGGGHYIAPSAVLIGSVILENRASIWFNSVLRADCDLIVVGENSNVQDGCVLHTDPGIELRVGANVTVGHQAMLHGCTIGEGSLIGIKAVILNHAVIGRQCLIGSNALVPEGKIIPERSVVVGSPGRVVRELTDQEVAEIAAGTAHYVDDARRYLTELRSQSLGPC